LVFQNAGLSPKTRQAAERGLPDSIYSVLVKDGKTPIGMGRVIGDSGCHCQVVDICVLPEYQGRGIGKMIMEKIMELSIRSSLNRATSASLPIATPATCMNSTALKR
jgi:ribosomal protein S18 acetylase RimI-like enzyme